VTPTQPIQGTEVAVKANVAVEVDGGVVCWSIRDGLGALLTQSRLTPEQALEYGRKLVEAAFEAKQ
jgi:hypothetical protein